MSRIKDFNEVIDIIEKNLAGTINSEALAKDLYLSVYEFRRIFSFIVGVPLGEYIRNRKMTLAYYDIQRGISISEVAEKYGYMYDSSFSRAFKSFHGVFPNEVMENSGCGRIFTKPQISLSCVPCKMCSYKIVQQDEFFVSGIEANSDITDTECCELAWNKFNSGNMRFSENEKIYAVYENGENSVHCTIGKRNSRNEGVKISKAKWLCFTLDTVEDEKVNEFYNSIYTEYIPSAGFRRNTSIPVVEVFPQDMEKDGFLWQICIACI